MSRLVIRGATVIGLGGVEALKMQEAWAIAVARVAQGGQNDARLQSGPGTESTPEHSPRVLTTSHWQPLACSSLS